MQWYQFEPGAGVGVVRRMCAWQTNSYEFYAKSPDLASMLLEVIHSDVCGPMQTSTFGGKRYFVTFIDEYSHYCVVYLLKSKSEVAEKFAQFVALAETQTGLRVRTLRIYNRGEYITSKMSKFCTNHGIMQRFTPPYTPQLNCRKNEPSTG